MEEQTKTKDVHALIQFCDILGNAYYEEYLFAEDETKHIQPVLNAISGKTPFDALPEDADKIASELFRIASRTIANVCINDFDRATKLLVAIRKQNLDNEDINEKVSIAIKNIAELKQFTPPFVISLDAVKESITTAFTYIPPLKGIFIKTYTQMQWDYINKRRSADYGSIE